MENKYFINQILNNFDEVSKLYLELLEIKINDFTFYKSKNVLKLSKPENFYFESDPIKTLLLMADSYDKIKIQLNEKEYEISKYETILIAGFIANKIVSFKNIEDAIKSYQYHQALYLSLNQKIDIDKLFIVYSNLNLDEELLKMIQPNDEKNILIYAKIARKHLDIKKSLEYLSMIKSKEYEIEKNMEYSWLHYLNKNYQNSAKIFNYYAQNLNNDKKIEALYGLSLSLLKLNENNIIKVKDMLEEILNQPSYIKLNILHSLCDIYFELKDYLKVIEISDKIIDILPDIKTLQKKCISLFLISNYEKANDLLYEIFVFNSKYGEELLKNISQSNIRKNPPSSFTIKLENQTNNYENEDKKSIIEAVLKPEDISKTKIEFSSFFTTNQKKEETIEEQTNKDEIKTLAFEFAKNLEEEFQTKVLFNLEGLNVVERKLRITFMSEISTQEKNNVINGASAFLTFLLKERFKAEIIKYNDLDPWTNEAIIKNKNSLQLFTYPVARVWLINWNEKLPEQGWLGNYLKYLTYFMNQKEENEYGKRAVISKISSHPEKIFDAIIEHKKILTIASEIEETSYIPLNPSSVIKIESEIRKRFKPKIPPTRDGWKILRCYAHIFLEIILKDIKPQWYNVEKNDGFWSFKIKENKFIFPIGKVYKTALLGESLVNYYDEISKISKLRD